LYSKKKGKKVFKILSFFSFFKFFLLSITPLYIAKMSPDTVMPPHPGLDTLTNIDELKHLCPAFSKGCPYAALEEVDSLAVSQGELSRW
jgi:hypothetical protein